MAELVALFPLSHVLLPGMPLPLHIFEQRYRDLLQDLADENAAAGAPRTAHGSFGVVALRSGTEAETRWTVAAGEGPAVEAAGTLAEIIELERRPDGAADLLTVGTRRFRVLRLVPDGKPYLRAEVEFLDEHDGALTVEQQDRARDLMDVYDSMLVRLAGRGTGSDLPRDPGQLAYQIASRLPLAPGEKQSLLLDDTTADRLVRVARLLRREIALLRGTRSIAVAPSVLQLLTGLN